MIKKWYNNIKDVVLSTQALDSLLLLNQYEIVKAIFSFSFSRWEMDEGGQRPYLAAVDLGTTSIRCFLYDLQGKVVSEASDKIVLLYPRQGWSEIDPEEVWKKFLFVFRQALESKFKLFQNYAKENLFNFFS